MVLDDLYGLYVWALAMVFVLPLQGNFSTVKNARCLAMAAPYKALWHFAALTKAAKGYPLLMQSVGEAIGPTVRLA